MYRVSIVAGQNKEGEKENFEKFSGVTGEVIAIVGDTGSGKSRLIKDIEQMANCESVSKRKVVIETDNQIKFNTEQGLVAHLGQNMRFMLDTSVGEFIHLHNECRNKNCKTHEVLRLANEITPESIKEDANLNTLSGGQTRALMIADIALICDSPIVLIDEIENAGIDKIQALKSLINNKKIVIIVTHDPHTALMANKRIIMQRGGVINIVERTVEEELACVEMSAEYQLYLTRQNKLRRGECLV